MEWINSEIMIWIELGAFIFFGYGAVLLTPGEPKENRLKRKRILNHTVKTGCLNIKEKGKHFKHNDYGCVKRTGLSQSLSSRR